VNEIGIGLGEGWSLVIGSDGESFPHYPSGALQNGLVLRREGLDICEEGVGFGVPVLKKKWETVFPGSMRILSHHPDNFILVEFDINRVERLSLGARGLMGGFLNSLKEATATLHRRLAVLRRPLTAVSNLARRLFSIKTVFIDAPSAGTVLVSYSVNPLTHTVKVSMDARNLIEEKTDQLVMMNELGARRFPVYTDSNGLRLQGDGIGTWDEVSAVEAALLDPELGIGFTVRRLDNSRLYRGRELVPGRLSWAGFAYALPSTEKAIEYEIAIGGLR
jgi:hypothetical protein